MAAPVLVVHGVNNRSREEFQEQVTALQAAVGARWRLIPVYWGDLAAKEADILYTVPKPEWEGFGGRSLDGAEDVLADEDPADEPLGRGGDLATASDAERKEILAQAILDSLDQGGARGLDDEEQVRAAIDEQWPHTRYLQHVESREVLERVGGSIAEGVQAFDESAPPDDSRGFPDIGAAVSGIITAVDSATGQLVGQKVGELNLMLREKLGPGFVRFLGDIFVYQRKSAEIQARLWSAIEQHAPGYGTEQQPVHVIAHSLGGVVTFDAAVNRARRLWINGYVTFGSQPSLFHVLDPRDIPPFVPPLPLTLPASIRRWTNLWEPMDPLAFLTAPIFRLSDGSSPLDVRVRHLHQSGVWTHSSYWTLGELVSAVQTTLVN